MKLVPNGVDENLVAEAAAWSGGGGGGGVCRSEGGDQDRTVARRRADRSLYEICCAR